MDVFTKAKRSEVMRAVKSKNTKLELCFRRALWKKGFRYATNSTRYFGTPDIVLRKHKAVVFVDSCFWHGCRKHCGLPAVRVSFWKAKIETNRARDKKVTSFYRRRGWLVFRVWEHDIKRSIERLIQRIEYNLRYKNEAQTKPRRPNPARIVRRRSTTA
jgi:DNA mismatch endonuclease (patch repair protein)